VPVDGPCVTGTEALSVVTGNDVLVVEVTGSLLWADGVAGAGAFTSVVLAAGGARTAGAGALPVAEPGTDEFAVCVPFAEAFGPGTLAADVLVIGKGISGIAVGSANAGVGVVDMLSGAATSGEDAATGAAGANVVEARSGAGVGGGADAGIGAATGAAGANVVEAGSGAGVGGGADAGTGAGGSGGTVTGIGSTVGGAVDVRIEAVGAVVANIAAVVPGIAVDVGKMAATVVASSGGGAAVVVGSAAGTTVVVVSTGWVAALPPKRPPNIEATVVVVVFKVSLMFASSFLRPPSSSINLSYRASCSSAWVACCSTISSRNLSTSKSRDGASVALSDTCLAVSADLRFPSTVAPPACA